MLSETRPCIAIYGGAFDPIHNGHLKTALFLQTLFHFDRIDFLPCKIPVLKAPTAASAADRVEMLKLALRPYPEFKVDEREILRSTPSYMVQTLESYRKAEFNSSISLVLGADAFANFTEWFQYEKILTLASLIIIHRPGFDLNAYREKLKALLAKHQTEDLDLIKKEAFGHIYYVNAGHFDISSTAIRNDLKEQQVVDTLLPPTVLFYIQNKQLYQS